MRNEHLLKSNYYNFMIIHVEFRRCDYYGVIYLFSIYNIVYYFYTVVSEFTRYFYNII